jgi:hypothetical protein
MRAGVSSRLRSYINFCAHPGAGCIFMFCMLLPVRASAQTPVFEIEIRDHLFYPAELSIPSGQKVKLIIYNRDTSPEEFESFELNREKVIMGKSQGIVFIGPLKSGEYLFFGEFNPRTAQGMIIAD